MVSTSVMLTIVVKTLDLYLLRVYLSSGFDMGTKIALFHHPGIRRIFVNLPLKPHPRYNLTPWPPLQFGEGELGTGGKGGEPGTWNLEL